MNDYGLVEGYTPGVIGRVTALHSLYYFKYWGFEQYFEIKVATELSEFISRYNENTDRLFSLEVDGKIEGSISIDGPTKPNGTALLRWFIVSDDLRGKGAGNALMQHAMDFCTEKEYEQVTLWTFKGLNSARHLYEKHGFTLVAERTGRQWGTEVTEQRFDATL